MCRMQTPSSLPTDWRKSSTRLASKSTGIRRYHHGGSQDRPRKNMPLIRKTKVHSLYKITAPASSEHTRRTLTTQKRRRKLSSSILDQINIANFATQTVQVNSPRHVTILKSPTTKAHQTYHRQTQWLNEQYDASKKERHVLLSKADFTNLGGQQR